MIRVVDLGTRATGTLALSDPGGLLAQRRERIVGERGLLSEQHVAPGAGTLRLDLRLPPGYKVNAEAPSRLTWADMPSQVRLAGDDRSLELAGKEFPLEVDATFHEGRAALAGDLAVYYCRSEESVCLIHQVRLEVTVLVSRSAESSVVDMRVEIQAPE